MRINHIAIYVCDLEKNRCFYENYFGGVSNLKYHNPVTGLMTYFLTFQDGSRLELMSRPDCVDKNNRTEFSIGLTHIAFSVGSREAVDSLTARFETDGYTICGYPRTTGDGYYESVILDPDGNRIEITI